MRKIGVITTYKKGYKHTILIVQFMKKKRKQIIEKKKTHILIKNAYRVNFKTNTIF